MTPLAIGQERSIKLVDDVVDGERMLALVTVKNPDAEQPGWDDLYEVGTAAVVHKMIRVPDGTLRILVQGVRRDPPRGARPATSRTSGRVRGACPTRARRPREVEALAATCRTSSPA